MLTSGHCLSGAWYARTDLSVKIGDTASTFWNGPDDNDFQKIFCNCSALLYNGGSNSSTTVFAIGSVNPGEGDLVTFDGAVSGTQRDIRMDEEGFDICHSFTEPSALGGQMFTVCHLDMFPNNPTIAMGGDSGGPVYVNTTTSGEVNAAGIICGGDSDDVFILRIQRILSVSGDSLVDLPQ